MVLRDADGTRRLTEPETDLFLTAPPGLEVHPGTPITLARDYQGGPATG